MSCFLRNGQHKWRLGVSAILFVYIVLAGALNSSAQDLGALARQEQARKEAQGIHPAHVYTNDDLLRPQILVPGDRVDLDTVRRNLPLALTHQPPAEDSNAQEVSLGAVARKYRELKLGRQRPPLQTAQLANSNYTYTNDDMTRPRILTPEDKLKYQAGLEKLVPSAIMARAEVSTGTLAAPEAPLGDIARIAHQQQEHILASLAPIRNLIRWPRTQNAFRIHSPALSPPRYPTSLALPRRRRSEHRPDGVSNVGLEPVTVRRGDSLWKLARQHLGGGCRWHALLKANPWIRDPNHLHVGTQIRV